MHRSAPGSCRDRRAGITSCSPLQVRQREWRHGHLGGAYLLESVQKVFFSAHLGFGGGRQTWEGSPGWPIVSSVMRPHVHLLEKHLAQRL